MIKYLQGTVFNSPAKTIVNTVNCVGAMGAGIALEFKLRYPEMYQEYKRDCQEKKIKIGYPRIYEYSDELWILNFPTKKHWKYSSKLEWIKAGLEYFVAHYKKREIESIAFPKLGCGKGGLDWAQVKEVMEDYLQDLEIDVYICLNEKEEAAGIEEEMVGAINKLNKEEITSKAGIRAKQFNILVDNLPVERFWHINQIKGIGKKSYEKLFKYFYQKVKDGEEREQLNLDL